MSEKEQPKKGGIIMRDLKEFIAPIRRKKPSPKVMAYGLQRAGYVDPNYKLKSPKKKSRRKKKKRKQNYIIRGGKAYPVG